MKKVITIAITGLLCFTANAQDHTGQRIFDPEVFRVCASIFFVGLIMAFIINILRRVFEYRLKNKIVDKGISENVATSILQTNAGENKNANIKWFSILAGIGVGLLGVNYTQPLGFHSLAIMAFSISLSFLGYYLFIRNTEK
jgi:hypothetical protein